MLRFAFAAFGLLFALPAGTPIAVAGDLCSHWFVPQGYGLTCAADVDGNTLVQPDAGLFGVLSSLNVRELDQDDDSGAFTDPGEWLTGTASLDLGFLESRLNNLGSAPDSPFGGIGMEGFVDAARAALRQFRDASLSACDDTRHQDKHLTELDCTYSLGPLSYLTFSRVVIAGDKRYAITARTMNPQRLRHFRAIANSFE